MLEAYTEGGKRQVKGRWKRHRRTRKDGRRAKGGERKKEQEAAVNPRSSPPPDIHPPLFSNVERK